MYKGAQCQRCKLHLNDSHYAVFEFHHASPNAKEYDWAKLRLKSWTAIKKELDKMHASLCKLSPDYSLRRLS